MTVQDMGRPARPEFRVAQERMAKRAIEWLIERLPYASSDVVADMCREVGLGNSHYVHKLLREYGARKQLVLQKKGTKLTGVTVGANPPEGAPVVSERPMTIRALEALDRRAEEGVLREKNPPRYLSNAISGLGLTEATVLFGRFLAAGFITQFTVAGEKVLLVPSAADLPDFELDQPLAEATGEAIGTTLEEVVVALLELSEQQQRKIAELQESLASREAEMERQGRMAPSVPVSHDACWVAPSAKQQASLRRLGVF